MRFEKVVIRNFRAIREYRLELPPSGVVVIEGENELGKSSIAEALWMVFEFPDSSENERVRATKPVDRDVGAEIEVTVSTGEYRFVYKKVFHRGHQTVLRIESPRREDLTGREAHDRVQEILRNTTDKALWEALRLMQGDALNEVSVSGNLSIARALDEAAVSLGGQREKSLFDRIENEYLLYYTATGREKVDYKSRRDAVQSAQEQALRIEQRLAEIEEMADRCSGVEEAIGSLTTEAAAAAAAVVEVEEQAKLRQEAAQAMKERQAELALADAKHAPLLSQFERRREAATDVAGAEARIASLTAELSDARARSEVFEAAYAEAETALAAGKVKLEQVETAVEVAQADYSYMHEQLQVQQMTARLGRAREAQAAMREATEFLNSCKVNPRVLTELEDLDQAIAVDRGRLEAEGAHVDVIVPTATTVEVDGLPRDVGADGLHLSVAGRSTLKLPGGVEVRISAGRSVAAIQEKLAASERSLAERYRTLGVANLAEARALETRRSEAVSARRHLEAQMAAALEDLPSADELAAKIERDRQRGVQHVASRKAAVSMPATLQEARDRQQTARSAEKGIRDELAPLENAVRSSERGLAEARERVRELERRLQGEVESREKLSTWLDARRAEQPDSRLAEELDVAEAACAHARLAYEAAELALGKLPDVSAELALRNTRSGAIAGELRAAEAELNRLRGALTHAGESGLHQQREAALTARVEAEAELDAFELRAEAARVLYETMKRHREAAQRSYARPLEDCLNDLGRKVFNPTFAIELDAELKISRRSLHGVTLDFKQLSGGAKEQLGILVRLACASLVSKSGGVPLILDDVLGWSDPKRVARLGRVLADAGADVQVIVLTCTPDRFRSVAPSTVISLPSGSVRRIERDGAEEPALTAPMPGLPRRAPARAPLETAGAKQAGFDLFEAEPAKPR